MPFQKGHPWYPSHHDRPNRTLARDLSWLVRFLTGEPVASITKGSGHMQKIVSDGIERAAKVVIEDTQSKLVSEVFPDMIGMLKRYIKFQMDKMDQGKEPDMALVEKLGKWMYVFEAPNLKAQLGPAHDLLAHPTEPESLDTFIAIKHVPKKELEKPNGPTKQITDGETTTD